MNDNSSAKFSEYRVSVERVTIERAEVIVVVPRDVSTEQMVTMAAAVAEWGEPVTTISHSGLSLLTVGDYSPTYFYSTRAAANTGDDAR